MSNLVKPAVFVAALAPALYLLWQVWLSFQGQPTALGADPGKAIVHFNGSWALRFLVATLAITPARQLLGWSQLARYRRMCGLYAFFYATLHVASYLLFLLELRFTELVGEVIERPYITVGFLAFCGMIPLAATSNKWMIRRLKQRWQLLHRAVYPIALLALVHLLWLTRSDYTEVTVYAALLLLLLGYRAARSRWLRGLVARSS